MFAHLTIATRDVRRTSEFFQQTLGWRSIRMPGNIDLEADWLTIAQGQQLHILHVAISSRPVSSKSSAGTSPSFIPGPTFPH